MHNNKTGKDHNTAATGTNLMISGATGLMPINPSSNSLQRASLVLMFRLDKILTGKKNFFLEGLNLRPSVERPPRNNAMDMGMEGKILPPGM